MNSKGFLGELQKIGKALMIPIAVLPAAALLLRLGAPDVFNILVVTNAGGAIFDNLALLFAIGISIGIAGNDGVAGLAGAVGYLVLTRVTSIMNKDINMGVLAGIIMGLVAGYLYNRYHDIRLPDWLGFFGGKRFVPIITAVTALILGILFGFIWPPVQAGINGLGQWIIGAGVFGVFIYGILNRLLIPLGLHHVINSLVWFVFGTFTNTAGKVVTGDLNRFFAGDPTAGIFMTGFFPIFMFGLPAACFAMIRAARPENRKAISGFMIGAALTAFLTGITEPIEFSFLFVAPVLYVVHAVLTGISLAVTYALGIRSGFGFSAGLIDYVLSYGIASKPLLLLLIGVVYFFIYYFVFYWFITKFNLPTPGRLATDGEFVNPAAEIMGNAPVQSKSETHEDIKRMAEGYLRELGGKDNIVSLEACVTRIRLGVKDDSIISDDRLRKIGATAVVHMGKNSLQVVVGTKADLIVQEMQKMM
ncbi:N-acetylglucosamine-specific PTS transporter subunit IIBC [Calorimonas adulescens]|uniref:PTS sugar transporter n=1 Tax=Calorimonas adulescens TaxID=2606906 RepID=A0A5D8QEV2_9THEO|nr:N-acetylglucosamine-specific PTS transporter subunit IIBC [Calorimonas adulescens]TZE82947.1 PTS sugar transporter [Calorimonas adulescens]